jgi:protein-tyrosine phosphatase
MAHPTNAAFPELEGPTQRLRKLVNRNYAGYRGLLRLGLANLDYLLGTTRKFTQPDLSRVQRLVFVCMANLKRSAFAQAVAEKAGLRVASFGIYTVTGQLPPPMSARVAAEFGYPLSRHRSTDMMMFRHEPGDLYLVMELRHAVLLERQGIPAAQIALLGHWAHPQRLHINDPHRAGEEYLRTCFTVIQSAVFHLGIKLKALDRAQAQAAAAPAPADIR